MLIPPKETLEEFLEFYCSSLCLYKREDREQAAASLHDFLKGYLSYDDQTTEATNRGRVL